MPVSSSRRDASCALASPACASHYMGSLARYDLEQDSSIYLSCASRASALRRFLKLRSLRCARNLSPSGLVQSRSQCAPLQAGHGEGGGISELAVSATEVDDDDDDERRRTSFRTRSSMRSVLGGSDELVKARLVWNALRASGRALRRCDEYTVSNLTLAALMAASAAR
jgi:hypothetical protein